MVTKTDLLKKLTSDQLREIAIAEDIEISEKARKDEIIKRLLKLPMSLIRKYAAEYADEEKVIRKRSKRASLPSQIQELVNKSLKIAHEKLEAIQLDEELGRALESLERESTEIKSKTRVKEKPEPAGIEVSEVLPDRISTGYGDLDNLLLGGIPKNYAVILTSRSCDERELLIKRFLEAGAKEGQITFHVTIEASNVKTLAEEFQSNFYLFICNPQANSIIKTLPNVFKLKGVENLTDINIALTSAFRKLNASLKGPRRACIEIISDVLLQHHAVSIRRWLTALIPELKSRGFTILAVINPHMHPSEEVQAILDLFEGEMTLYQKQTKKYLRITKMYDQRYLENELPLRKERLKA